ncbi:hypothetical protein SAMN06265360_1573, partial [Haloechinothrix alba]
MRFARPKAGVALGRGLGALGRWVRRVRLPRVRVGVLWGWLRRVRVSGRGLAAVA